MAARLFPPFNAATDADGNPLPGAKLWTFASSTTTLKTTWQDAALSVPHQNPIVADSAGRFPLVFCADHDLYRLKLTDTLGAQIVLWDYIQGLGEDYTQFQRDFTTNGRARIFGESGHPRLWWGDPTGDDVGGSMTESGWADSQGDTKVIDFATTHMTGAVTADGDVLTEGGKYIGLVRLQAGSPSAASLLELTLDAGYERFRLELVQIHESADASSINALAYISGSYHTAYATVAGFTVGTGTSIPLLVSMAGTSGADTNFASIEIWNWNASMICQANYQGSSATASTRSGGWATSPTGPASKIKLVPSSGAFSFTYVLYGYKKLTTGVLA